jgi:ABC-type sugar transport system, periplasmic component
MTVVWAVAVVAAMALTACGSSGNGSSTVPSASTVDTKNPTGSLLVWTDATRQPSAEAYAKAHPSVHVTVVTIDAATLRTKLQLLSRTKDKWPDVVFTATGDAKSLHDKVAYSADLSKLVDRSVVTGFGSTLGGCGSTSTFYCLPLDISTQMLWYNSALMTQFGYTVPTTWADYEALAKKVATEHPGYVVGSCGDGFCPNVFYRASGCPGSSQKASVITVDNLTSDAKCSRVTNMLQPLLADGTMAKLSPFDPDFTKLGTANKVLMLPGFVWYGGLLFQQTFKNKPGTISAAPLPTWPDGIRGAGASLGGQWAVSSTTKNLGTAINMIEWETTDQTLLNGQVTFPAYSPAAPGWTSTTNASKYYAGDIATVFTSARADANTQVFGTLDDTVSGGFLSGFANIVAPGLKAGKSLDSLTSQWAATIKQTALDNGFTVQ